MGNSKIIEFDRYVGISSDELSLEKKCRGELHTRMRSKSRHLVSMSLMLLTYFACQAQD